MKLLLYVFLVAAAVPDIVGGMNMNMATWWKLLRLEKCCLSIVQRLSSRTCMRRCCLERASMSSPSGPACPLIQRMRYTMFSLLWKQSSTWQRTSKCLCPTIFCLGGGQARYQVNRFSIRFLRLNIHFQELEWMILFTFYCNTKT